MHEAVKIKTGNYRWLVMPEYRDFLEGKLIGVLEGGKADPPGARIIKKNKARTVYYLDSASTGGKGLFLKRCNVRTSTEALQYALFPDKVRREWKNLVTFRERGLDVPHPAFRGVPRALGSRRPGFLAVEEISDVRFPNQVLDDPDTDRRKFLDLFARWVRTVLDAGLLHRDFQPGNVLVQTEGGSWKFNLIDLHAAGAGRLTRRREAWALAKLLGDLSKEWLDLADRRRFLDVYLDGRPDAGLAADVERLIGWERSRVMNKRSRLCLENSEQFAVERKGPWKVFRRRTVRLDDVLAVVEKGVRTVPVEGSGPMSLHVKHISGISVGQNLKDIFQGSRGRCAYAALAGFEFRGLDAPVPVALVESRPNGMLRGSFLVTERIEDAADLAGFVHGNFILPRFTGASTDDALLRRFIRALADAVRRVHEAGVVHRDMKGENLLVREAGGEVRIFFLDLDSVRFKDTVSFTRVAKNLAQLGASVPYCVGDREKLRFFFRYVKGTPLAARREELLRLASGMMKKRIDRWLALYWRERRKAGGDTE